MIFLVLTKLLTVVTAFLGYAFISTIKKTYLTIYDDHIQGYALKKILPTEVTIEYSTIASVDLKKGVLCVNSNGETLKFPIENSDSTYMLLKEKCHF